MFFLVTEMILDIAENAKHIATIKDKIFGTK